MMRARLALVSVLFSAGVGLATLAALQPGRVRFPHRQHERLFPVCQGCHAGVSNGSETSLYPTPASCAECHDGSRQKRVEWTPPPRRASNLRFVHIPHFEKTDSIGQSRECQSCHAASASTTRMDVGAPNPELCVRCHQHRSSTHLAVTADCRSCHIPLAEAQSLAVERLSGFPRPAWHDSANFVSMHGRSASGDPQPAATCGICHARETCERCHPNANRLAPVIALARDARVAALQRGRPPEYPTPSSHKTDQWGLVHGRSALKELASCANCHTQTSCSGCHVGGGGTAGAVIAELPPADPGTAPGVQRAEIRPAIHPPDIAKRHANVAATAKLTCTTCHSQATCASCHYGSESRAFHLANFVERHASDAFARSSDCQSCHSTERFCRECHTRTGIAAQSGMNAAFHTGQPMWFLAHGQAARTGLESCASCHRQNDCVRCHSAVGGWRVNPHGPDFSANRVSQRNSASCRWCHSNIPISGAP